MKWILKHAAIDAEVSNRHIAEAMEVSDATVSAWLSEKRHVPPEHREKLADILKISVADIAPPNASALPVDEPSGLSD